MLAASLLLSMPTYLLTESTAHGVQAVQLFMGQNRKVVLQHILQYWPESTAKFGRCGVDVDLDNYLRWYLTGHRGIECRARHSQRGRRCPTTLAELTAGDLDALLGNTAAGAYGAKYTLVRTSMILAAPVRGERLSSDEESEASEGSSGDAPSGDDKDDKDNSDGKDSDDDSGEVINDFSPAGTRAIGGAHIVAGAGHASADGSGRASADGSGRASADGSGRASADGSGRASADGSDSDASDLAAIGVTLHNLAVDPSL